MKSYIFCLTIWSFKRTSSHFRLFLLIRTLKSVTSHWGWPPPFPLSHFCRIMADPPSPPPDQTYFVDDPFVLDILNQFLLVITIKWFWLISEDWINNIKGDCNNKITNCNMHTGDNWNWDTTSTIPNLNVFCYFSWFWMDNITRTTLILSWFSEIHKFMSKEALDPY